MNTESRESLEKRREVIKQELSTLDQAITDIDAGGAEPSGDELQKLRSARETRRSELREVEARLGR